MQPEDLLRYGLIPEFIGRLPVATTLRELDEPALVEIITTPKNALVKQYARMFEMEGAKLTVTDDAVRVIARRAISQKTGARGLRSIFEAILLDTMFHLPSHDGVQEVVIDSEVAEGRRQPLMIFADPAVGSSVERAQPRAISGARAGS